MLGRATAFFLLAAAVAPAQTVPPPKAPRTLGDNLHAAVRAGDLPEVERLLAVGAPVEARDALGSTPLLDAAWVGKVEIAAFLIQQGADVNARHLEAGSSPLQYAVLTNRPDMVQLLLKAGARVTDVYRDGQTLLHAAAARGNAEVIELLLAAKADIEAQDAAGNTPLAAAVWHGKREAVEKLLQHGADVATVHPSDGRGALHLACLRGFADLIPLLVAAGANPTLRDHSGQTPLDVALAYKNGAAVAALLLLGQRLKESQKAAEEAMEAACARGQVEIARVLLDNGFEVRGPSANGGSYLNDAALRGQLKMVQLLLDHGADIGARNQTGGTPLHDAALGGHPGVVEMLLKRGATIDDRERDSGATPLMMAASLGRADVVAMLLHHGASTGLVDKSGLNALERARRAGSDEVVKLLLMGNSR